MTFLADLAKVVINGVLLLALSILVFFFIGWCLGWVVVGFRAVAG